MARLEDITRGASVKGILPEGLVTIVDVKWIGTVAVEATYKDAAGRLGNELVYRDHETTLDIAAASQPWSFDGDGPLFRLVSEARRNQLAHLFDPLLAVWEITQHLVRTLETKGEAGAAELLNRLGGMAETARELAYGLYSICERKKWAEEALAYNSLVIAWPEILKLARSSASRPGVAQQELF